MSEEKSDPTEEDLANSGIPPPRSLGASKKEALALLLGVAIVAIIIASFWLESGH